MSAYPITVLIALSAILGCQSEFLNPLLPREIVTKTGRKVAVIGFKAKFEDTPTVRNLLYGPKEYNLSEDKWRKTTLTYCVRNYPTGSSMTNAQVDQVIARSVKVILVYFNNYYCSMSPL